MCGSQQYLWYQQWVLTVDSWETQPFVRPIRGHGSGVLGAVMHSGRCTEPLRSLALHCPCECFGCSLGLEVGLII